MIGSPTVPRYAGDGVDSAPLRAILVCAGEPGLALHGSLFPQGERSLFFLLAPSQASLVPGLFFG